jgi:hypothetical protein
MILDPRFLLQFVRDSVKAPVEPVRPTVTGGRYVVLEPEVAAPPEHPGAFITLEKGRHWKKLKVRKEHGASASVRGLLLNLR